ncbi:MAG: O-methyltransferase [Chloroflexi bacterium]|nr:MAG: O-methyltransferase [Chloroflexota bacterium]
MRNAMDTITLRDLQYLDSLHPELEGVFARMDAEAAAENIPIVSSSIGHALRVLVRATAARRIVEVGTATGYSALWMASALPTDGRIITIDPDRSRTDRARAHWRAAGVADRIEVSEYAGYLAAVLRLLRAGGTVLVDNLLWDGRASGAVPGDDADTRAIREFNRLFVRHPQLDTTILSVGDGLGVGVKR